MTGEARAVSVRRAGTSAAVRGVVPACHCCWAVRWMDVLGEGNFLFLGSDTRCSTLHARLTLSGIVVFFGF